MSEVMETSNTRRPPLRISQVQSACSFCKRRKIKCDGVAPCGGCTRFNRQDSCSLSTGAARGRDYPSYLQNKIRDLQRQIHDLSGARAAGNAPSTPSAQTASGTSDHNDRTSHVQAQATIDDMLADIGALPIQASSYSLPEDVPTLSTVLLGAATNFNPSRLASMSGHRAATVDLPPKEEALKLATHYFQCLYPRLPFFSSRGFWAQFELAFAANFGLPDLLRHQINEGAPAADTPCLDLGYSCFTVLLVLAISSSTVASSSDSLHSYQSWRFFNTALRYAEFSILPNTIVGIQSLLFLIQFAMVRPSILNAWYLIGVGMRSGIDLGLHQDPQPLDSVSPSLLETRRQLWWSIYSLDRSMSIACGRPTEISDSVINASLPSFRIESSADESQIQGYLQRYRALQLQSQIYDKLGRPAQMQSPEGPDKVVTELSKRLRAWQEANDPTYSQTLVESEWLMGKMVLYRPCPLLPERKLDEIIQLWEASCGFIAIYRQLVEKHDVFYVQLASEKTYWAGLATLYCAWKLCTSESYNSMDATVAAAGGSGLWRAVQNVLFILSKLSTKWEEGELLTRKFESASTAVIEYVHGDKTHRESSQLPCDIVDLCNYCSSTSILARARVAYGASDI